MILTIESTDQLTHVDGVPVRVWHGTSAGGARCLVFVHRVAVAEDGEGTSPQDEAEFDRELRLLSAPGASRAVDLRHIL